MSGTKTIDIKGLGHAEKEGVIFPSIEKLTADDMHLDQTQRDKVIRLFNEIERAGG